MEMIMGARWRQFRAEFRARFEEQMRERGSRLDKGAGNGQGQNQERRYTNVGAGFDQATALVRSRAFGWGKGAMIAILVLAILGSNGLHKLGEVSRALVQNVTGAGAPLPAAAPQSATVPQPGAVPPSAAQGHAVPSRAAKLPDGPR